MDDINLIARLLHKNNVRGFKQLGNNPGALNKFKYINDVLPNIDNFMITDKADGERAFLIIDDDGARYLTAEKITNINAEVRGIFDCEVINGVLYVFDVIKLGDAEVWRDTFEKRYDVLENIDFKAPIKKKKFYKLKTGDYQKKILDLYKSRAEYTRDGLIFTEIDADYNKTRHFKWKPPHLLTIDFLAIGADKYKLMSGVDTRAFKRFGMTLDEKYFDDIKRAGITLDIRNNMIYSKYIPVEFKAAQINGIENFEYKEDINGHIVELSYDLKKGWVFHKIRNDRDVELKNGTYYGNNFKIAELTLQAALNPLTLGDLCAGYGVLSRGVYFKKTDDKYKSVRKFNNYVKQILINRYKTSDVMDLASGRGQDIMKYAEAGVRNLTMLEIDIDAIDELLEMKYNAMKNLYIGDIDAPIRVGDVSGCNIEVRNIDLNADYKKNIKYLNEENPIKNKKFDLIVCNFALHYMMGDKKMMLNIVKFVSYYLAVGGSFIFTAFDGRAVYSLLKDGDWIKDKYSIKKKAGFGRVFKGFEKIEVLLPCSNEPYEEPLINIFELDKAFLKEGIKRIESAGFERFLEGFADKRRDIYNNLNIYDKEFVKLYSYSVFSKI